MPYHMTPPAHTLPKREKVKYNVCGKFLEVSKSSDSSSKRRRDHISKLVNTVNVGCPDHNICIATCGTSEDRRYNSEAVNHGDE